MTQRYKALIPTPVVVVDGETGEPGGAVTLKGSTVQAAGKKTDADTSDRTITADFGHLAIINEGPSELRLAIDANSTTSPAVIYVGASESFEGAIAGAVLHYSVASGSTTFRYVLR